MPPASPFRYWAFISYCHEDRLAATRLQSAIERFKLPPDEHAGTSSPAHLRPIFLDRDVLGSGHDLTAAIRHAIDESRSLVVICSPAAAASRWVAREIEHFAARHGREQIFCLVVAGEPNADTAADECLPLPLRRDHSGADVLAADARPAGDGWHHAMLKIISGLSGIPFPRLARREQKQARRRMLAWTATSLVLAAVFGLLALHSARQAQAARESARRAELIAGYLGEVIGQFRPREDQNVAAAALLPLVEASTHPERLQRLANEPEALIRVRHTLASAFLELNAADRARPLLEENIALATATLGPTSPVTLSNLNTLGSTLNALGEHEAAEPIHRQLLEQALQTHGEKSEETLRAMTNLAVSLGQAGRHDEARGLFIRVYTLGREFMPADHVQFQSARRNYAGILQQQGQSREALVVLEELHRDQLQSPGPNHLVTHEVETLLGEVCEALDQPERAAAVYTSATAGLARILGPDNPMALYCAYRVAILLQQLERPQEARDIVTQYFGDPPDAEKISRSGGNINDLTSLTR